MTEITNFKHQNSNKAQYPKLNPERYWDWDLSNPTDL